MVSKPRCNQPFSAAFEVNTNLAFFFFHRQCDGRRPEQKMTVIEEFSEFRGIDPDALPLHASRICGEDFLHTLAASRQCQKIDGFRPTKASSVPFAAAPSGSCIDGPVQIEDHVKLSVYARVLALRGDGQTR
jgi:hypothetical protein